MVSRPVKVVALPRAASPTGFNFPEAIQARPLGGVGAMPDVLALSGTAAYEV